MRCKNKRLIENSLHESGVISQAKDPKVQRNKDAMNTNDLAEYASSYAPWRKGISWWAVLIQALIALGIGIFALFNKDYAAWTIIGGFCVYFILSALRTIWQALRGLDIGFSVLGLLAAGGGLAVGTAVLIPVVRAFFGDQAQEGITQYTLLYVFGVAVTIIGLLATGSAFVERPEQGIRWASVIRGLIFVILGGYILIALNNQATFEDSLVINVLSWGFVIIGILLAGQSFMLYRSSRPPVEATTPTTPAAPAA
jgi:cation transport ATPase